MSSPSTRGEILCWVFLCFKTSLNFSSELENSLKVQLMRIKLATVTLRNFPDTFSVRVGSAARRRPTELSALLRFRLPLESELTQYSPIFVFDRVAKRCIIVFYLGVKFSHDRNEQTAQRSVGNWSSHRFWITDCFFEQSLIGINREKIAENSNKIRIFGRISSFYTPFAPWWLSSNRLQVIKSDKKL